MYADVRHTSSRPANDGPAHDPPQEPALIAAARPGSRGGAACATAEGAGSWGGQQGAVPLHVLIVLTWAQELAGSDISSLRHFVFSSSYSLCMCFACKVVGFQIYNSMYLFEHVRAFGCPALPCFAWLRIKTHCLVGLLRVSVLMLSRIMSPTQASQNCSLQLASLALRSEARRASHANQPNVPLDVV
jgi:hypothetical protein